MHVIQFVYKQPESPTLEPLLVNPSLVLVTQASPVTLCENIYPMILALVLIRAGKVKKHIMQTEYWPFVQLY